MFMGVYSCTGPMEERGVAGYIAEWGGSDVGVGSSRELQYLCSSEEYKHST